VKTFKMGKRGFICFPSRLQVFFYLSTILSLYYSLPPLVYFKYFFIFQLFQVYNVSHPVYICCRILVIGFLLLTPCRWFLVVDSVVIYPLLLGVYFRNLRYWVYLWPLLSSPCICGGSNWSICCWIVVDFLLLVVVWSFLLVRCRWIIVDGGCGWIICLNFTVIHFLRHLVFGRSCWFVVVGSLLMVVVVELFVLILL